MERQSIRRGLSRREFIGATSAADSLPFFGGLPLSEQIQLPPVPGQDVPEPMCRLVDHERELQALRELARRFGL